MSQELSFNLMITVYAWVILGLFQAVLGPWLLRRSPKFIADGWWGMGRILSWLVVSLGLWILGHLKVPIIGSLAAWLVLVAVLIPLFWDNVRHRKEVRKILSVKWKQIVVEEVLFFGGFFYMSLVRGFNPEILDLEKFMDAGFMAGYLKTITLPANDIWLAGSSINYYTFGHFMGAVMTKLWGLPLEISYNLLLGLIMGLTLTLSYSFVLNMIAVYMPSWGKFGASVGAFVGAVLVTVGGNSHTIWYFLSKKTFDGYWYADATRFIENTIHEFPAYSFVVSDLHAHLWGLPLVLLFLSLWLWVHHETVVKETNYFSSYLLGGLLGVMMMTNTWDLLVYGGLLILDYTYLFLVKKVRLLKLIPHGVVMCLGFGTTGIWWITNFDSISEGIMAVTKASPWWQLLALWSIHVGLCLLALVVNTKIKLRGKKQIMMTNPLVVIMMVVAFGLLAFPEFFYFKDIYPTHPRANTMFKLTYQAFILMSLIIGWMVGMILSFKTKISWFVRVTLIPLVFLAIGCLLVFPYFGFRDYYGSFKNYKAIDGYQWMVEQYPDDYKAIIYLRDIVNNEDVVLESVGESYTHHARVSMVTGVPTVLGWRVHEWLWRGGFDIPAARTEEVSTVYTNPESMEARLVIEKYKISYIFLGSKEREIYAIDEDKIRGLGTVVFESGSTVVVKL